MKNLSKPQSKQDIDVLIQQPSARGRINHFADILALSKKYHKTPVQIALRWALQMGSMTLTGSSNVSHIQENFDILDFTLTESDLKGITEKAKVGNRERVTIEMGFGFADEFDFTYDQCWHSSL